jgi:hypothetical protein
MKVGIMHPQTELGGRAKAIRRFGVAVEELGFNHLPFYDHVVGARHEGREPKLTVLTMSLKRSGAGRMLAGATLQW